METRRRRSCAVALVLLTSVASVAGCDEDEEQILHCVDQDGMVVAEDLCTQQSVGSVPHGPHYYGGGHHFSCHYVYHTDFHRVGTVVRGGSSTPLPGRSVVTHTHFSTRSGGFGSTGMRFGMGGG